MGDAGCMDAKALLSGRIKLTSIQGLRGKRAVVDFGTMNPRTVDKCPADYAIFTHYDRYAAERATFPAEARMYEDFIAKGSVLMTFRPIAGKVGGPVVRVVKASKDPQVRP